jgi:hypothetical protein
VNPGGEPERDDTGLPPVDIEIPDDARDLDRDVQAYRRELRALRRSDRRVRWHRSLGKEGVALPLLACCLILALITGTLLTVFTATSSNLTGLPGSATAPATSGGPVPKMVGNQALPDATISVDGSAAVPVQALRPGMLVLVPPGCGCSAAFNWLAGVAAKARAPAYVIYTSATYAEVQQLYSGLNSQLHGLVRLAKQTGKQAVLSPAKVPAGIPADQLTAILVAPDRVATWVSQLSPRDSQAPLVQVLTGVSA